MAYCPSPLRNCRKQRIQAALPQQVNKVPDGRREQRSTHQITKPTSRRLQQTFTGAGQRRTAAAGPDAKHGEEAQIDAVPDSASAQK
jgi:hypothetical protein